MPYSITKLRHDELEQKKIKDLSFWAEPALLSSFAKRDEVIFYYLVASEHDNIKAIMPVFEKRKFGLRYLIQPYEYYYTPIDFFIEEKQSLFRKQNHELMILKEYAIFLKKEYFKFKLHLDPSIRDIRAFKRTGFRVEPLYTYTKIIKEYESSGLPKETKRLLQNKAKKELYIKENWDLEIYKALSISMLNKKNRPLRQVEKNYLDFLNDLYDKGFCTKYIVYKGEEALVYLILLKDKINKYLYAFYSAMSENGKKIGANIFCFDYILSHHYDFEILDFTGANNENIAFFKSQFNCELVNYYRIGYR